MVYFNRKDTIYKQQEARMPEKKVNVTLRIEPELKKQASELFSEMGLDLSTATGIFFRQALRCRGLPVEVKLGSKDSDAAGEK